MSDRQPYYYAVLRYIHDTVTGEFVNVGLAMFSEHGVFCLQSQVMKAGAFEKAITILQKAPVTSEIYLEGNMDNLVDKLQEQVDTHY